MYANFIGESSGFGILRPGSAFLNYFHFIGASPGRAECHPKSQLHDGQPSSSLHGRLHPHPESRPSQQGVVSLAESGQDKCSVQCATPLVFPIQQELQTAVRAPRLRWETDGRTSRTPRARVASAEKGGAAKRDGRRVNRTPTTPESSKFQEILGHTQSKWAVIPSSKGLSTV